MGKIKVIVDVDVKDGDEIKTLNRQLGKTKTSAKKAGDGFSGLKSAMLPAVAVIGAATAAFVAFGAKSLELANEQTRVETQLASVLSSTGMAAGLTATELKNMASELQNVTTFGDEAIIGGQNLLLTFTNIGKDVFPAATATMLDMSTALGQDLKTSAVQLGKALNDPVLGVTSLTRAGVQFTDVQKEMISTLVEAGDVAGAQAIIMAELNTQFGGSAQAQVDTFAGGITQLSNSYGDLQEQVGFAIQRNDEFVGVLQRVVSAATSFVSVEDRLVDAIEIGMITQEEFTEILMSAESQGKSYEQIIAEVTDGLDEMKIEQEKATAAQASAVEMYKSASFATLELEDNLKTLALATTSTSFSTELMTEREELFAIVAGNLNEMLSSQEVEIRKINEAFGGTATQAVMATEAVSTLFDGIAGLPASKSISIDLSVTGFNAIAAFLGGGGQFGEFDFDPEVGDIQTAGELEAQDAFDPSGGGVTINNNFNNADSPAQIAAQLANQLGGNLN